VVLAGGGLAALLAGGGARWRWPLVWVLPALVALNFVPRAALPPAAGTRLMIVQANLDQARKLAPDGTAEGIRRHLALTEQAMAAASAPAAVIWPEAAVEDLVEEDVALRARLAAVLPARTLLLFGGLAVERDSAGWATYARNSLFAMDAAGRILARYDKAHLVPGGEYLPLRAIAEPLGLARLVPGGLDFLPGTGPRTLALPGLPGMSPQICYEIIFPGAVADRGARAAFILNVSNDAWFGPTGPPQHWEQARLRAIEEGLPVVRSTPTGITGVIDARGGVVAALPTHKPGVLNAILPTPLPPTLFARLGLAAPIGFALFLIALGLFAARRERKT
jgi:apolipoprotein N-acyltransferase